MKRCGASYTYLWANGQQGPSKSVACAMTEEQELIMHSRIRCLASAPFVKQEGSMHVGLFPF